MIELDLGYPSAKQFEFLRDKHRHSAYGGARGGGKSWAARMKAVMLCSRYPGLRVLLMRRTFPELLENHVRPLQAMLAGIAQYKATEELVVLKELQYYLQVQDPDTGDVGYIHKKFAAR